ncbi:MAG: glycosyltransferase [Spongiibacteraceae bacterium]
MMSFKPCLLIPVYNHGPLLAETITHLKTFDLHCLLVDDGSDETTAAMLREIAAAESWVTLLIQRPNQGKGVAVLAGIAEAQRLGFTHALQVDADGQHAVDDIPAMLAMAAAEPEALISGAPVYDASVPRSRLYGRYITHFWVWIETLSFSIVDSMCGFRVYPVAATHALACSHPVARRMDFDTDVMVRLYWRGVAVRFLPTQVRYPDNGISHFALWQDNLRISRMHTKLVFGMLRRLPQLLKRKWLERKERSNKTQTNEQEINHWSQATERGAYLGMWFSVSCYRIFGRKALNLLLYPIIAYFFLTNKMARRASQEFLQRVYDYQQLPALDKNERSNQGGDQPQLPPYFSHRPDWRDSYNHLMNFGRAIVDRLGSWAGEISRDDVVFHGRERIASAHEQGQGGVILASHLGNAEMCRALADGVRGIKVNLLTFSDNAGQIGKLMKKINPLIDMELIQVTNVGADTAFLLADKISKGEYVVITADRTSPTAPQKAVSATFLGDDTTNFPQGAFILAGLLECPVYLMFCLTQHNRHHIYIEFFAEVMAMPRRQRLEKVQYYAQQYAQRLQHYTLMAPLQWFNFYDFWEPSADHSRH